jgi:hypothetical protein
MIGQGLPGEKPIMGFGISADFAVLNSFACVCGGLLFDYNIKQQ